jgi:hypothetical protein
MINFEVYGAKGSLDLKIVTCGVDRPVLFGYGKENLPIPYSVYQVLSL